MEHPPANLLRKGAAGRLSLDAAWKLHHVGSGRWVDRIVRVGTAAGMLFLAVLVLSMIGVATHSLTNDLTPPAFFRNTAAASPPSAVFSPPSLGQ
jgi:hypothetical protein